jgi:hypothetical protein
MGKRIALLLIGIVGGIAFTIGAKLVERHFPAPRDRNESNDPNAPPATSRT